MGPLNVIDKKANHRGTNQNSAVISHSPGPAAAAQSDNFFVAAGSILIRIIWADMEIADSIHKMTIFIVHLHASMLESLPSFLA